MRRGDCGDGLVFAVFVAAMTVRAWSVRSGTR